MSQVRLVAALSAAFFLHAGCDKIDFGDEGGITEKDSQNVSIGEVDNSDWTVDENWNSDEKKLFDGFLFSLDGGKSSRIGEVRFAFYPNPVARGAFGRLGVGTTGTSGLRTQLRYVIVNRSYKVLQEGTMGGAGNDSYNFQTSLLERPIQLDSDQFAKGRTYRLYYVLYGSDINDNKVFLAKGHGDISITK